MPIQTEQSAKRIKKTPQTNSYLLLFTYHTNHTYVHTLEQASNQANETHENKPKMFISQKSNLPTKPELLKRIQIKSPQSYTHTHTHTTHTFHISIHTIFHHIVMANGNRLIVYFARTQYSKKKQNCCWVVHVKSYVMKARISVKEHEIIEN